MKAGVIAAKRDNGIGSNGIADNAEIMTLRIHPGEGEPYLKDMALAIRYAVNHGADVIVLPEQKLHISGRAETMGVRGVERGREERGISYSSGLGSINGLWIKTNSFPIVR